MNTPAKYFIVEADAMPEIFRKVAEAKRLLETGEETTVNSATRAAAPFINIRTLSVPSTICFTGASSRSRSC